MSILGIENRTENWKTVQHFQELSDTAKICLAQKIGEPKDVPARDIKIELFWKGVRDYAYAHAAEVKPDRVAEIYNNQFANLRQQICDFREFNPLKGHNYMASRETQDALCRNLQNTEIDIVLETPGHLFIGEAKHKSRFGGDGKLVLVHQLIRQYVTATVLLDLIGENKQVVPFIVADESVNNTAQVKFMVHQRWLKRENVLSWCDIAAIRGSSA